MTTLSLTNLPGWVKVSMCTPCWNVLNRDSALNTPLQLLDPSRAHNAARQHLVVPIETALPPFEVKSTVLARGFGNTLKECLAEQEAPDAVDQVGLESESGAQWTFQSPAQR